MTGEDSDVCTCCYGSGYDGNREARCHCQIEMTDLPTLIDHLDALHAAATAGEWYQAGKKVYQHGGTGAPIVECFGYDPALHDTAFIASVKNAWPAVSAELRALRTCY